MKCQDKNNVCTEIFALNVSLLSLNFYGCYKNISANMILMS